MSHRQQSKATGACNTPGCHCQPNPGAAEMIAREIRNRELALQGFVATKRQYDRERSILKGLTIALSMVLGSDTREARDYVSSSGNAQEASMGSLTDSGLVDWL